MHPTCSRAHTLPLLVGLVLSLLPLLIATPARGDETVPSDGVWPLTPRPAVMQRFDPPAQPWQRGHRGVDLGGRIGQPVRSSLPGVVAYVGSIAGRGVVVVRHGRLRTTYEPVAGTVEEGQTVAAGAMIGRLSLRGSHCLPRACLHWGLIRGRDTYLDPLALVGCEPRPVRLYPLLVEIPAAADCPTAPSSAVGLAAPSGRATPDLVRAAIRAAFTLVGAPVGRPTATGPG